MILREVAELFLSERWEIIPSEGYMGVSKNNGKTPQIIHFNRVFHYKPSILGSPYFWKHPHMVPFFPGRGGIGGRGETLDFYDYLGGGNSKIFLCSPRTLGKISNLTSIFFKGVETTNQEIFCLLVGTAVRCQQNLGYENRI